jgi:hypothetical protein
MSRLISRFSGTASMMRSACETVAQANGERDVRQGSRRISFVALGTPSAT